MNCSDCRAQLPHYKLDALDPLPRALLEDHLVACAACRAEYTKFEARMAKVLDAPEPELPAGALDRLMVRVAIARPAEAPPPEPAVTGRVLDAEDARAGLEDEPTPPPRRRPPVAEEDEGPGLLSSLTPEAKPIRFGRWRAIMGGIAAALVAATYGIYQLESGRELALSLEVQGGTRFSPGGLAAVRLRAIHPGRRTPQPGAQLRAVLRAPDGTETQLMKGVAGPAGTLDGSVQLPMLKPGRYQLVCGAEQGKEKTQVTTEVTVDQVFRVMLTTDKPTYQPGQTVYARALVREVSTGLSAEGKEITFTVSDAKGNKVGRSTARVDSYGVAGFEFPLADEIGLGAWKLLAEVAGAGHELAFSVDRYVLPKFAVKAQTERPWYKPGELVTGTLNARYFFGKPLAKAKVKLAARAATTPVRTLAEASGEADAEGTWRFSLALPRNAAATGAPVELQAEIIDSAGERVEKRLPLALSEHDLVLHAVPEGGALVTGVENRVNVLVVRPDGEPVPKATVTVRSGTVDTQGTTGPDGIAQVALTYGGMTGETSAHTYVSASTPEGVTREAYLQLPARAAVGVIRTERTVVRAGEKVTGEVRLANVSSGHVLVDVAREGSMIGTFTVPLQSGRAPFSLELPKGAAGAVTLFARSMETVLTRTEEPEDWGRRDFAKSRRPSPPRPTFSTLAAQKTLFVAESRQLTVSVTPDTDTYRPGGEAKLTLRAVGDDGKPAAASIGLAVVDESVFAMVDKDLGALQAYFQLGPDFTTTLPLDSMAALSGGANDRAAAMLLTRAAPPPTTLGTTSEGELSTRRQALYERRQKAEWGFAGGLLVAFLALIIGLWPLFVGLPVLRYLGCSGLTVLLAVWGHGARAPGWFIIPVALAPLVVAVLVDLLRTPAGRRLTFIGVPVLAGMVVLALLVADLPGPRALFASSANALGGEEANALALAAGAGRQGIQVQRKAIKNFGSNSRDGDDEGFGSGGLRGIGSLGTAGARPPAPSAMAEMAKADKPAEKKAMAPSGGKGGAAVLEEPPAIDKSEIVVRSWFPETMFWSPGIITGADGTGHVTIPLADSITTWRMSAVGSAADGRLGAGRGSLRVFQDFFVDLDLPVSLTVGDEVEVRVAVHNYLSEPQKVRLEVEAAPWFDSLTPRERVIELAANQVKGVPLRVKAKQFGDQTLTVWAAGTKLKDAIRKTVEVRPDGVKVESVSSGLLADRAEASARFPAATIAGTGRMWLRMFPGAVGSALEGIEGLLSQPHGCFEQTSATTYPNVLVLRHLRETKKNRPEVEAKATAYIQQGYQKLLSFEVPGGGFEWFGRAPANRVLTAFGLLEFVDMKKVYPAVDEAMIERTRAWLLGQQRPDGSWLADSHAATGVNQDTSAASTTAYVAWALAESGYRGEQLDRALQYLARAQGSLSTYGRALWASALLSAGRAAEARPLVAALEARVVGTGSDGPAYLTAEGPTAVWSRGKAANVETTALAGLVFARDGRPAASRTQDWLVTARDPRGAWGSTQATVLALRTLLESATRSRDATADFEVKVRVAGEPVETWRVGPSTSDIVRQVELTKFVKDGALSVELTRTGPGVKPSFQLVASAWIPAPPEQDTLLLAVAYDKNKLETDERLGVKARLTWKKPDVPGMVMASLPVPPGFQPDPESLNRLVAQKKVARWSRGRREVTFYLDGLATGKALELPFELVAAHPAKVRAPAAQAWLYYQPEVRAESKAAYLVIEPPKVAMADELAPKVE